jgi:hypothetical protein
MYLHTWNVFINWLQRTVPKWWQPYNRFLATPLCVPGCEALFTLYETVLETLPACVTLKLGTTFQTWAKNYLRENGLRLILTKDLFAYKFRCVCMLFLGTYTNQVYLLIEMVNSNSSPYVLGANLSRQLLFCRTFRQDV